MTYSPSTTDKDALQFIEDLHKSLGKNIEAFERAPALPQQHITMSIIQIKAALLHLAEWQQQRSLTEPITAEKTKPKKKRRNLRKEREERAEKRFLKHG